MLNRRFQKSRSNHFGTEIQKNLFAFNYPATYGYFLPDGGKKQLQLIKDTLLSPVHK